MSLASGSARHYITDVIIERLSKKSKRTVAPNRIENKLESQAVVVQGTASLMLSSNVFR